MCGGLRFAGPFQRPAGSPETLVHVQFKKSAKRRGLLLLSNDLEARGPPETLKLDFLGPIRRLRVPIPAQSAPIMNHSGTLNIR